MNPVSSTTADRTLRVYLSATFRDFLGERRFLHTVFLPQVRWQWESLGLTLDLIDPGWDQAARAPTSEEAVEGDAKLTESLRLIDSCRPHFLCFLGQRYGKGFQRLTAQLVKVVPWIRTCRKGVSRLHLEMHHGFLQKPGAAPFAYVYLRGDNYFPSDDEEARRINLPDSEDEVRHLLRIGPDLEAANRPLRPYDCKWDAARKESCDFDSLRDQLLVDFGAMVRAQIPDFPELRWEAEPVAPPSPETPPKPERKPEMPSEAGTLADFEEQPKVNPLELALEDLLGSDSDLADGVIRPKDLLDRAGAAWTTPSLDVKVPDWMEPSPAAPPLAPAPVEPREPPKQIDAPVSMPELSERPAGTVADIRIESPPVAEGPGTPEPPKASDSWDDETMSLPKPEPEPVPPAEEPKPAPAPVPRGAQFDENVQFTVFRPRIVEPEWWYDLLAYAHLGEKRPDAPPTELDPYLRVTDDAKAYLGSAFETFSSLRQDSLHVVPKYGEITFAPEVPGVEFNPPTRTFRWLESVHREDFRFRAESSQDGKTARGKLSVYLGAILLADVPIAIRVQSDSESLPGASILDEERAKPYRKIFASYAHDDASIVEQFESYVKTFGDEYLRDCRSLRAGQVWNEELRRMIREADVFQLFWSSRSMMSKACREEWEYALSLGRPNFIRPTFWEQPMPARKEPSLPPKGLAELHFQFIGVQVETRPELIYPVDVPPDLGVSLPPPKDETPPPKIDKPPKDKKPRWPPPPPKREKADEASESFELSNDSNAPAKPATLPPVPPPEAVRPEGKTGVPRSFSDGDISFELPVKEKESSPGVGKGQPGDDLQMISEEELLRGNTGMGFPLPDLGAKLKPKAQAKPKSEGKPEAKPESRPKPKPTPEFPSVPKSGNPPSDEDATMMLDDDLVSSPPPPTPPPKPPAKPPTLGRSSKPPAKPTPPIPVKSVKPPSPMVPPPLPPRALAASDDRDSSSELPAPQSRPRPQRMPRVERSDSNPIVIAESNYVPRDGRDSKQRQRGLPTWLVGLIALVVLGAIGLVTVLILRN